MESYRPLKNIYYNWVGFISRIQEWFNIRWFMNVIHVINRDQEQYMIISIYKENLIYKI